MTKNYKIAEYIFSITSIYDKIHSLFSDYLSSDSPDFFIVSEQADIDFERKKSEAQDRAQGIKKRSFPDSYLETLSVYRKMCDLLIDKDVLLFHSSALEIDGVAYLFTAPSGTGKSTHARLWREYFGDRVVMINDDKPLIRIAENRVTVYGTPYGGKDGIQNNRKAKVGGIFVLHQAEKNSVREMSQSEAYPMLFNQTYRSDDVSKISRTMELVQILSRLPVYSLGCNISYEAVTTAYNALNLG